MKRSLRLTMALLSAMIIAAAFSAPAHAEKLGVHHAAEPGIGQLFAKALRAGDEKEMRKLIETRSEEVPDEVIAIVQYAIQPDIPTTEQDGMFNLAGIMAQMYGQNTGDERLLNGVRKNYQEALNRRREGELSEEAVDKTKKELVALGGGAWRVTIFELDEDGALNVEIGVRGDSKAGSMTPRIDIPTSQKAKQIVVANLPDIKNGAISWSSMGVGLKTIFIGEGRKR